MLFREAATAVSYVAAISQMMVLDPWIPSSYTVDLRCAPNTYAFKHGTFESTSGGVSGNR